MTNPDLRSEGVGVAELSVANKLRLAAETDSVAVRTALADDIFQEVNLAPPAAEIVFRFDGQVLSDEKLRRSVQFAKVAISGGNPYDYQDLPAISLRRSSFARIDLRQQQELSFSLFATRRIGDISLRVGDPHVEVNVHYPSQAEAA